MLRRVFKPSSSILRNFSSLTLKNPALLRNQCYINGEWLDADSKLALDVTNPSTGELVGTTPLMGTVETERAIQAASDAFPEWSGRTAKERANILRKWYNLMLDHQEDIATILTAEQGKPLPEAMGEVIYAANFYEFFAEEAIRTYGETIPTYASNVRVVTVKQPVGVVGAITPWNFPAAMITRKAGPALAAGCTMVVKPSELTPLTAFALAELGEQAGVPNGVFNVLTGEPADVGGALTASSAVRKFSFTGSTPVGKLLYKQCGDTVKKISLELGGNAPLVIFDDADMKKAVDGTIMAKFRNAGQTCVCANRIYVQAGIHDQFVDALTTAVRALSVGDGFQQGVQMGPLINEAAVAKVQNQLQDAQQKGATVTTGGEVLPGMGSDLFMSPAVLTGCTKDMLCFSDETFGPLCPVFKFDTEEEVLGLCNDSDAGLAAYFFSKDSSRVWRFSEGLQYGMVGVNQGLVSHPTAPFGGVKESGIGREGSLHGMAEYMDIKTIHFNI